MPTAFLVASEHRSTGEPQLAFAVKSMRNIREKRYVRSDLGSASVMHDWRNDMLARNRIPASPGGNSGPQA
jgi:hypothetical protein